MATLHISDTLRASHDSPPVERDFKIEIVVEGKIDSNSEYVSAVDFFKVRADLKKLIIKYRGKYLRPIMIEAGFKTSVLESMGVFLLKELQQSVDYDIKSLKIWEDENTAVVVDRED